MKNEEVKEPKIIVDVTKMRLHERCFIEKGKTEIIRVPGGWIYTFYRLDCGQMNSVFVPEPPLLFTINTLSR